MPFDKSVTAQETSYFACVVEAPNRPDAKPAGNVSFYGILSLILGIVAGCLIYLYVPHQIADDIGNLAITIDVIGIAAILKARATTVDAAT